LNVGWVYTWRDFGVSLVEALRGSKARAMFPSRQSSDDGEGRNDIGSLRQGIEEEEER
jgi:hypothetical protein